MTQVRGSPEDQVIQTPYVEKHLTRVHLKKCSSFYPQVKIFIIYILIVKHIKIPLKSLYLDHSLHMCNFSHTVNSLCFIPILATPMLLTLSTKY
jgi:hypothetical protein